MSLARRLLQIAYFLLWVQLFLAGQLNGLIAIFIAILSIFNLQTNWLRHIKIELISLICLTGWSITAYQAWWISTDNWFITLANLLWLMTGLKLLETHKEVNPRNAVLVLFLSIGTAGIVSQGLASSLIQGIAALLCITALIKTEAGSESFVGLIRRSLVISTLLTPVVVAGFILLPRMPALWNLPGNSTGSVGLSAILRPGDLASLVQTEDLVARVFFKEEPPPQSDRYWRVFIHNNFDGFSWRQGPNHHELYEENHSRGKGPIIEKWLIEASPLDARPWSGHGYPTNNELKITNMGKLMAFKAQASRGIYTINSNELSDSWRKTPPTHFDLEFISGNNPRLEALGKSWGKKSSDPIEIVDIAKRWFNSHPFVYTLEPGRMPKTAPYDAFLFDRQMGFCEHYAASFSALMRAAGVPSRIVVGYQGGEWKESTRSEDYLLIDNSNVHAWSEVWIPTQGWIDIDPTSWVAPERVRRSLRDSLSNKDLRRLSRQSPNWYQALADQWQALDNNWQLWIMAFDSSNQKSLLRPWLKGKYQFQGLVAIIAISLTLTSAIYFFQVLETGGEKEDQARRELDKCLFALSKLQFNPVPGETLQVFCNRAAMAFPELKEQLDKLHFTYNRYRFDLELEKRPNERKEILKEIVRIKTTLRGYIRKHRLKDRR